MFTVKLKLQQFISNQRAKRIVESMTSQVRDVSWWGTLSSLIIKFIVLFIFGLFIIFPFYFMIVYAFASDQQITDTRVPVYWPDHFNFNNFSRALKQGYLNALGWTALITLVSVISKVFFSMTFGYAFSLKKWRFKKLSWVIFLSILVLPETALLLGQYRVMVLLQWTTGPQSFLALTAPFVASVFSGFMFRNAFEAIPDRIKEAAMMDGCSQVRMFFKVAIPMVTPTIWTVGILTAFAAWNSTLWPLLILTGNKDIQVLNVWLLDVGTDDAGDEQLGFFKNVRMAGAILAILPMFIIYFGFRRRILNAISRQGSTVKG
ncbi:carbohydrate ABC transporter permease [Mesomycoplasma bovoculi]|uniref:ABC transporter permease n=1 Tax=Mesomycoplasma bovoculi M165/69 TaxID=743966 RepID=W5UTS9_9BACT|nr:carbohydrate ABC transporter permease [Mesomycoplasma bovoculi]AHH45532.1 ABC transporter permease [Mesomycoplasma bovoculi M165/69]